MKSHFKPLRKNTKIGKRVRFQFIEELTACGDLNPPGIVREAIGNFCRWEIGGMVTVWIEHTNIEITTLPWAVQVIE